jgi:hypothetical protein
MDKKHFCMADNSCFENCKGCKHYKSRFPTPEQFLEEYGRECRVGDPIWVLLKRVYNNKLVKTWTLTTCTPYWIESGELIVCACTPWGKPPDNLEVGDEKD